MGNRLTYTTVAQGEVVLVRRRHSYKATGRPFTPRRISESCHSGLVALETDVRQALGQSDSGDLRFQPRQRRAEAEMDAVAEGHVRVLGAADVEALGIVERLGIAVGRVHEGEDPLAFADPSGRPSRDRRRRHVRKRPRGRRNAAIPRSRFRPSRAAAPAAATGSRYFIE